MDLCDVCPTALMTVNNMNSWNCVLLLVFRWRHLIVTEDEMLGWHHGLTGREFEQALGDTEGQGSMACCTPGGSQKARCNQTSYVYVWLIHFAVH